MKTKIILQIKGNGLKRNEAHFEAQLKNRMQIQRDRTKYTRKNKHKDKVDF